MAGIPVGANMYANSPQTIGTPSVLNQQFEFNGPNELADQAASIAGMFVMPSAFPITRLRDQYSNRETAVMRNYQYRKVKWDPTSTQVGQLPVTDWGSFFFRNMLRSWVLVMTWH